MSGVRDAATDSGKPIEDWFSPFVAWDAGSLFHRLCLRQHDCVTERADSPTSQRSRDRDLQALARDSPGLRIPERCCASVWQMDGCHQQHDRSKDEQAHCLLMHRAWIDEHKLYTNCYVQAEYASHAGACTGLGCTVLEVQDSLSAQRQAPSHPQVRCHSRQGSSCVGSRSFQELEQAQLLHCHQAGRGCTTSRSAVTPSCAETPQSVEGESKGKETPCACSSRSSPSHHHAPPTTPAQDRSPNITCGRPKSVLDLL